MSESTYDVGVIGGGHAGLGTSYFLAQEGVHHIVFERGRIGESWRTQRWDSFVLNSPNKFNVLPGDTYDGPNPYGFDRAQHFVSYLESYAERFHLPVQENARVVSVERNSEAFHLTAMVHGAAREYHCRQVVVASGAMNAPRRPPFWKNISPKIRQYHAGEYRAPAQVPGGAVLVVGSAQSGLQVAEDLIDAGRRVYLSTSAVGRVPRRYRGKDVFEWLLSLGFFDMRTDDVADARELDFKQPQVSGVGPLGHTLSLQSLAKKGLVVVGKLEGAVGNEVQLQPNAADHVRFGDEASTRLKALIDRFIAENHLDAPAPESDPADLPDINASCVSSMRTLDLERENVRSVIWATGFDGDFSYLKDKVVDGNGRPEHRNGISGLAGLYFVGFPWLRKRKSGIILGIVEDAAIISDNVKREWSK